MQTPSRILPPCIGEPVPTFSARSTKGPIDLAEFRGRWLVLFAHPADFTPVCTSEFVALARLADRFVDIDCALIGLSVDSLFSHFAWVRAISDRFGVTIDFPIVEDPSMAIVKAYGMLAPEALDASTVRTTMVLDPEGVLRASIAYPAEVGRSVPEILRLVTALQRVQRGGVLAPADWTPGADLLCDPTRQLDDVFGGAEPSDWFYRPVKDTPR